MFSWVGSHLDSVLNAYVIGVVSTLMSALTPVALTAMTLWISLYGWAVARNEVSEPIQVFAWKVFKIGLVFSFALQSALYMSSVAETSNDLAIGVARTFLPAHANQSTISSPYALLDRFNDDASKQVSDIMKDASVLRPDLLLAAALFSMGSVVFLCIALFVVTLSKLLLTFVIAVGPVFILCLAWRPTARFFDSWLSMVLNTIVLTWFAFFALGLSSFIGSGIFNAIEDGGGFLGGAFNVLGEATRYCVLMFLMAIICFQAPSLASALTGGAAVQQGVQMIQNAMMVAGLRSAASARSAPAATAGGVIRAGAGLPHTVAAGAVALGSNLAARASTATHRGTAGARTPAYKLAALRGRT